MSAVSDYQLGWEAAMRAYRVRDMIRTLREAYEGLHAAARDSKLIYGVSPELIQKMADLLEMRDGER